MCTLTAAIAKECKSGKSGLSDLWMVETNSGDSFTLTGEVVTAMTLADSRAFFSWKFSKDSAKKDQDIVSNIETGTTTFVHKLALKFYKYETTKRNEIKLAAQSSLMAIVKDHNGKYWLLGKDRGLDMQPSTSTSGAKIGDFNGFELSFMSEELDAIIEVDAATIASLSLS